MPYAPGVQDISGQIRAQYMLPAAKALGQGVQDFATNWAQYREETEKIKAKTKAFEDLIKTNPDLFGMDEDRIKDFLSQAPDESVRAKSERLGQFVENSILSAKMKQVALQTKMEQQKLDAAKQAMQQQAADSAFVGEFLKMSQQPPVQVQESAAGRAIQQGGFGTDIQGMNTQARQVQAPPPDVRQMLARAIQAGNIPSPQALDRIDTIAKFFQPQQQAEIIPINQLENKYPSERFSVDSVPIGNGMLQVKSVNTRAPQSEKQKFQSISPMADESGKFVGWSVFDETKGKHFLRPTGEESAELPITPNLRPITPTALNREIMGMTDFKKISDAVVDDERSLNALSRYWKTVEDSNVGWRTLADKFAAGMKTVVGEGKKALTTEELNRAISEGRLQGLIGGLRTTVVGPGVMTEQDALRIIARLGGDVNALRNPEVVRQALMDLYQDTHSRYTNNLNFYNAAVKSYYGSQGNFSEKKPVGMDPKIFGGDIIYGGALVAPSK